MEKTMSDRKDFLYNFFLLFIQVKKKIFCHNRACLYRRHFDWHMCQDHIDNINIITDKMWRYFAGVSPPLSKKMKTSEEKLKIQRLYEISKRKRAFNSNWKVVRPWLGITDEEMGSSTSDAPSTSSQASTIICTSWRTAGKIDPTILAKNSFASGW